MQLLRKIAFPLSLVYALVVYVRNFLYDQEILATKTFKTPTICVGNLSVGGTGKTPMIELLIDLLHPSYKISVLSRGYGRKTKGFILINETSTAERVGDEPLQIKWKYPHITVAVDEDRQRGISMLEDSVQPDVILLDDAFQHRKVQPRYAILLTSFDKLYKDDWYLPTGDLRDGKNQSKRANIIVVTKCPSDLSEASQTKIIQKINPTDKQEVLFSYLEYDEKLKGYNKGIALKDLKEKQLTLVTGIAKPESLVKYMEANELNFEHLSFKDHHFFSDREIALLKSKPNVITTAKDYVRLKGKIDKLSYITVGHRFIGRGHQEFVNSLKAIL